MKFRDIVNVYNEDIYKVFVFFGVKFRFRSKLLLLRKTVGMAGAKIRKLEHLLEAQSELLQAFQQQTELGLTKLNNEIQRENHAIEIVSERIAAIESLKLAEFRERVKSEAFDIERRVACLEEMNLEEAWKQTSSLISTVENRVTAVEHMTEGASLDIQAFKGKLQSQEEALKNHVNKLVDPLSKKLSTVERSVAEQSELRSSLRNHLLRTTHLGNRFAGWPQEYQKSVLSHYSTLDFEKRDKDRVVVYMTQKTTSSGLADRLRTMLTAYVIAAEAGKRFYIYHDCGFKLEEYLRPNIVDWRIEQSDIAMGLNKVYSIFLLRKFEDLSNCHRECHVYQSSTDIDTDFLPAELEDKYSNHEVFNKLFNVTPKLRNAVLQALREHSLCKNGFIAVHFRFLNFFEQVERGGAITSTEESRALMLRRTHATLERLHSETQKKILLFSDSNRVLQEVYPDYVKILSGTVGHVSKFKVNDDIILKAFVDLFAMSKARTIYSVVGENLYAATESIYGGQRNGFAKTAAYIGNVPFVRYQICEETGHSC